MRELLKPRWFIGHLLIIAMSFLMLHLGQWQLHRLDERKATNRSVESGMKAPATDVTSNADIEKLGEFSRVRIEGTWDPAHTVYRRYPIRDGVQGYEVLEPIKVAGGATVVVNRGFLSLDDGLTRSRPEFSASLIVDVEGLARDDEKARGKVGANNGNPSVPTVETVNPEELAPLMGAEVAGKWVQLTAPVASGDPLPLELPSLDEGPHKSYFLQWLSFTATILIGWIAVCYRVVRPREDGR